MNLVSLNTCDGYLLRLIPAWTSSSMVHPSKRTLTCNWIHDLGNGSLSLQSILPPGNVLRSFPVGSKRRTTRSSIGWRQPFWRPWSSPATDELAEVHGFHLRGNILERCTQYFHELFFSLLWGRLAFNGFSGSKLRSARKPFPEEIQNNCSVKFKEKRMGI